MPERFLYVLVNGLFVGLLLAGCSQGNINSTDDGWDASDAGDTNDAGDPGQAVDDGQPDAGDPGPADEGFDAGDPGQADQGLDAGDSGDPGIVQGDIYVDLQITPVSCNDYDVATRSCGAGAEQAYKTLAGGAAAAGPGDVVLIRQGDYNEALIPQTSGNPGQPITYRNYAQETATISGASLSPGIDISGRQYLIIEGLTISDVRRWLHALDAHYNIIRNNNFLRALDSGGSSKTGLFFQEATHNRILDNTIDDSTQDNLALVKSDRNLVQGNTFGKAVHTLWTIKCGNFNVIRDNYFYNEIQKIGEVFDCDGVGFDHQFDIFDATRHNLIERNDFAYTASSGNSSPYSGIQYAGQQGVIRYNRFYNTVGPGLQMTLYSGEAEYNTDNRIYHNVFYSTDFAGVELSGSSSYAFSGNIFINNIFNKSIFVANDTRWDWYVDDLAGQPVQIKTGRTDGFVFDSNCIFNQQVDELYLIAHGNRDSGSNPAPQTVSWWQTNQPNLFKNCLEVEPHFENAENLNFQLGSLSTLKNAGAFLTKTVGLGSGTALVVEDASFFYDGYQIPEEIGDEIQLEGQLLTAIVTAIDYNTNTLTLDRSLSWTAGLGVCLKYNGTAPDLGAYESQ
ncbi:MAG: right-handed parallel beta-helix repeat-containing protein [Deltaproteobacteria bacterium]|nr:right-handed parallel beta-helix repeat-containing protein [Deltaproteobacteria bacterium]